MYNFINEALDIDVIQECVHDTSIGYEADFSENGDVDGWDSYTGIHTYGSWNGFLFGTLYGASGRIGRSFTFTPVPGETHYTLRISMKINPNTGSVPTTGRVMWRTLSHTSWDSDKTYDFTVYPDNVWHTYNLNMGNAQWWQGDVNDLRIYPVTDGADGDEFFIREIKITSVATFACDNPTCSYYNSYTHSCGGVGSRAYCLAQPKESNYFDIISGVNDELAVNINGYGDEIITLNSGINIPGDTLAKDISKKLSKIDIGGYSENKVTYSELGRFKIYSGTSTNDSTILVSDSSAAETLGFFSGGSNVSTQVVGTEPADGYKSKSSFKIKSFQLLELFDSSEQSYVEFDPYIYNVEGGRRDWVRNGLGSAQYITQPDVGSGEQQVTYDVIDSAGKTTIDFNHPFNASGKIKKIYMIGSMVDPDGAVRTGCKLKIFRRRKNGTLKTIHTITVPNRTGGKLYSKTQEYVAIDCDIWVNKGDLIGSYNIDVYVGKSYNEDVDALYFQVSGNPTGTFDPGVVLGDGNAGLFFYARSEDRQQKLVISVDFGKRINIEDVTIKGESESEILEYNIARCLDIDWQVDLFGETHDTGYWDSWVPEWKNFNHPNVAYGLSNLTDGIYGNENGLAADSYSASDANGVIPTNPHYFWVNGDEEWVGTLFHVGSNKSDAYVTNFDNDPIAFSLTFPLQKSKTIFKSAIYFKERQNFRNFSLAYYLGPHGVNGNAYYREDEGGSYIHYPEYKYIPRFTAITIDNLRYYDGMEFYDRVDDYIFQNPCNAKPIVVSNYVTNYDEWQAAEILDWNVIEHEWSPVECKGFRIYTDYHLSTKINEMELYCYVENEGTNVADSTSIRFSQYEDIWTDAVVTTNNEYNAEAFIGNTPQYFTIEIEPLTTIKLSDIAFSVDTTDLYVGDKGCRYTLLLDHSKIAASNQAKQLDFKNIYGKTFDLYIDIPQDQTYEEGLTFWSKMNDEESLSKPEIGPGAYYSKREDRPIIFREKNCAINCPCYGLKNIVDGKKAYYSHEEGHGWFEYGTLSSGVSIDFPNINIGKVTVIDVPILSRNRWWKIGFSDSKTANIREMRVLYGGIPYDCTFYYDDGLGFLDGPVSDLAPHLNNNSLAGSYYKLKNNGYISFDIGSMEIVDRVVLFHDSAGFSSCTMSIYVSPDNTFYGHYADVNISSSDCNRNYYTYFAIDLEKRYDLQIVRNYGGSDLLTGNVSYSGDDVDDIYSVSFTGTANDARWLRFRLLNGDGTSRYLRKIGIYPDITNYIAPQGGCYNHSWQSLGTAVTNYSVGRNVALGAEVSSSSTFGELYPGKITDGIIGDTITEVWGSDTNATQWIEIDLGLAREIYRVKVFHGYNDSDTDYMIEDYTIETSTDGSTYTTRFTITGNTDFEREHVLDAPVTAQYVKMNITSYVSSPQYLPRGGAYSYDWFEGAVLREIEVNEYYGFTKISSEEFPIIAINLTEQFPVVDHELIGIDPEDTSTDWSNAESNFAYSDSILDEPEKISFSSWGAGLSGYTRWVAIRRNTATGLSNGPDYLKHAKMINSEYPHPVKYPWWWISTLSTLSWDHLNVILSSRTLKIEYPASSSEEHIYLMEGDTFGTDTHAAWRDAFTFWWYIDNVNNLDDTYGYIYFGDANSADNVEYRWYLSSLLPNLSSGWNNLFLRFKSADEILYEEDNDPDAPDPRIISNLELKSIGLRFRGIGNPITMNIDGFDIERNRFMDYSKFHQGFYITGEDYIYTPLADFTLKKGTIEFWLRPDYNPIGVDYFNQFKYRSLFHFTNVANDVFGALIGLDGTIVYYGNVGEEISTLNFETPYWDIDDLFHLGFVFSNDGTHIDNDGSTIRLYFNNELAGKTTETWDVGDSKKYNFFIGGKNIHAVKEAFPSGSIDGVVSNFKIYNYCKTDFADSIGNYEVPKTALVRPNEMIEISKDNITFYNIGDTSLPLVYNSVPNNNMVSVYIRSIVPDGLTGAEKRTASIVASWHVTI